MATRAMRDHKLLLLLLLKLLCRCHECSPQPKKDKAAQPATPAASGEPAKGGDELSVDLLDIRVGQIVKVGRGLLG